MPHRMAGRDARRYPRNRISLLGSFVVEVKHRRDACATLAFVCFVLFVLQLPNGHPLHHPSLFTQGKSFRFTIFALSRDVWLKRFSGTASAGALASKHATISDA